MSDPEGPGYVPLQETIQRAKVQLESMIDLNPQAMVFLDSAGIVMRANLAFVHLVGGQRFPDVLGISVFDLLGLDEAIRKQLAGDSGPYTTVETTVPGPHDGERVLRISIVAGATASEARILVIDDVTALRQQEKRTEKTNKFEAIQALTGALMHNLNQPLTVIMIRAQLMLQAVEQGKATDDELRSTLSDIMDISMKMAGLLRRIETLDRFETQEYTKGLDILKLEADA